MLDFSLPQWTSEITDTFVKGEDMLGLEGAAQAYQHANIPGITTVTHRARYYSFYAWVLYRYIHAAGSNFRMDGFRGGFFHRFEMAFLLAAFSHHYPVESLSNLVGSDSARGIWEGQDPVSLDSSYFQNKLGGFGQYYGSVMQAMEIILEPENSKLVYRLRERGQALAQAFERSISHTHYFRNLGENDQLTHLSHADALELGPLSCLCPGSLTQGADLPLLRDAFFRFDQLGKQNSHTLRRQALGLVLEIVEKGRGTFTEKMLRPVLYLAEFGAGNGFHPSPEFPVVARRWQMVETRHLYTFGFQALWAAFLLQLRNHPNGMDLEKYFDWISTKITKRSLALPMNTYLDQICALAGLSASWQTQYPSFDAACKGSNLENEYALFLGAASHPADPVVLLNAGMGILARHFLRFLPLHREKDPNWQDIAHRQRLPMAVYYEELQRYLAEGAWTVREWLMWIYRQYILGQHQFMALEKLRYQNYDTFKFLYRDGRFYWPFSKPDAYREPIRLAGNRLSNAVSILIDLAMLQPDDAGQLSLTSDGMEALNRIKGELRGH